MSADAIDAAGDATGRAPAVPAMVGVLGGGRMGAGIAHAFCIAGSRVAVVERDAESARLARGRVLAALLTSVERATTQEPLDELTARIAVGVDRAVFSDAQLVIEAVPESLELKLDAIAAIESVVAETTAIATNTSSISISTLANSLAQPSRFCGLHFFNPVPSSRLVEIVIGHATDAGLVDRARGWVTALGKTPIAVQDVPGFASSRLGVALAIEAIRMVEDGVASVADIDTAMVLGYGHPVGPLKTTDIVGLDVRLGIAEYLQSTLGERFAPPALLRELVAAGHLGRKTGKGFYDWPKEKR